MGDLWVGTSGYASPSVRDAIQAPTASAPDLLTAYAARFPAVELESVFYRRPSPETVGSWRASTPEDFSFVVRVPREVTHVDRLGMPARVSRFVESLAPLGRKLGGVLFTTPPSFDCDVARFEAVLDALPTKLRTAWEFRHPSWLCPGVLALLAERNSAPVIVETHDGTASAELLPGGALADKWGFPFVYVRFRREVYTYADLVVWGEILGDVVGEGRDVYAFFRQSPESLGYAMALEELLEEAKAATFDLETAPQATP